MNFGSNPRLIRTICLNRSEPDNTWNFIFMERLDPRFYHFIVLRSGLIDRHDLFTLRESPFPPIDTFHRIVVRTSDESRIHKIDRDANGLWFRWMCDIQKYK